MADSWLSSFNSQYLLIIYPSDGKTHSNVTDWVLLLLLFLVSLVTGNSHW